MNVMSTATSTKTLTYKLGNTIEINRMGYGAMQLTGTGVFGEVADREPDGHAGLGAVEVPFTSIGKHSS